MTADPAVEAAQRVWEPWWALPGSEGKLTEAAREALAPVRELHHAVEVWQYDDINGVWSYGADGERILLERWCAECSSDDAIEALDNGEWWDGSGDRVIWPCDTARLIYPESEL